MRSAQLLHVHPTSIVLAMQLAAYLGLFYVVWELVTRSSWGLWISALIISPATLAFQVLNTEGGYRKEILLLAALGLLILLLLRQKQPSDVWLTICLSIGGIVTALSHEGLVFFAPYVLAALAIGLNSVPRALRISLLPAIFTLGAFVLAIHHPGNMQMASRICASLGYTATGVWPPPCRGAIAALAGDQATARAGLLIDMKTYHYATLYAVTGGLALIPIPFGVIALRKYPGAKRDLSILAFAAFASIAASSALFIYADDWGRWIYCHLVSIFLLLLFVDIKRHVKAAVNAPETGSRRPPFRRVVVIVMLLLYATCWDLPAYGHWTLRFGYVQILSFDDAPYEGYAKGYASKLLHHFHLRPR
jgi:hypothetical protein